MPVPGKKQRKQEPRATHRFVIRTGPGEPELKGDVPLRYTMGVAYGGDDPKERFTTVERYLRHLNRTYADPMNVPGHRSFYAYIVKQRSGRWEDPTLDWHAVILTHERVQPRTQEFRVTITLDPDGTEPWDADLVEMALRGFCDNVDRITATEVPTKRGVPFAED